MARQQCCSGLCTHSAGYLSRQHISHDFIHVHQLPGSAALGINGGGVSQAQGMQLLPHSCQPIRKLRDIGAIQAVYAVGAKHAML